MRKKEGVPEVVVEAAPDELLPDPHQQHIHHSLHNENHHKPYQNQQVSSLREFHHLLSFTKDAN